MDSHFRDFMGDGIKYAQKGSNFILEHSQASHGAGADSHSSAVYFSAFTCRMHYRGMLRNNQCITFTISGSRGSLQLSDPHPGRFTNPPNF